ncbi:acyl-CoA thioesterase [Nonomuraea turkmeniaca]|uniref:Acyl-CoA thioesterase n=1 Tax=Nonomuraea turkmeniaca TaxID=103838 RepID=A0A5S4FFJ2_9ACTN|nr:acyl-CoA thioesterase [Nonomuraea turkmeniaca]TMR17526.1 acyl-CoA thioesterase [Nonomuraea turkmeniaca]
MSPARRAAGLIPDDNPTARRWFAIDHYVTFGETSAAGFVYYLRLLEWQGHCRERFGYAYCPDYMNRLRGELVMPTCTASCEYLTEIYPNDLISIRLSIPWLRLHLMKGEFVYYRISRTGAEELVARGEQQWANMRPDGETMTPEPWPEEVLKTCRLMNTDLSRALIT